MTNHVEPLVGDEFLKPYVAPIKPSSSTNFAMINASYSFMVEPPSLESFCRFKLRMSELQMARLNHIFYQLNCMIRALGLPKSVVYKDSVYPKWVFQEIEKQLTRINITCIVPQSVKFVHLEFNLRIKEDGTEYTT